MSLLASIHPSILEGRVCMERRGDENRKRFVRQVQQVDISSPERSGPREALVDQLEYRGFGEMIDHHC